MGGEQALVGAVTSAGATYYLDHEDADLELTKPMPQVQSCKSRTPATPRDRKARGKDWRKEEMLFGREQKMNCGMLEWEGKLAESGKIRVEGRG